MTNILLVLLVPVNLIISVTVLPHLPILMFDTFFVMIVCVGLVQGEIKGGVFGFAAGFVNDMFFPGLFGFFSLLGFALGFICGMLKNKTSKESLLFTTLVVLGVVLLYQTISLSGQLIILGQFGFLFRLHTVVLPKTVLTTALFVPVYMLICFVRGKYFEAEFS